MTLPVVAPGTYNLIADIVPAPGNIDPNLANNQAALPVTVLGPDFAISSPVFPAGTAINPGTSFTGVTYSLLNERNGALPVGTPLLVQVFLAPTATFSAAADTLLDSYTFSGGLGAGPSSVALQTATSSRPIPIPANTPGGAYDLLFIVDGNSTVTESGATVADPGTALNVLAVPITVNSADLAVTSPATATTSIGVNTTLSSVSTFVQNQGTQALAGGYTVSLYISTSSTFDTTAQLLATLTQSATLNPLSSIQLSFNNVAVPNLAPGGYFLITQVTPLGGAGRCQPDQQHRLHRRHPRRSPTHAWQLCFSRHHQRRGRG